MDEATRTIDHFAWFPVRMDDGTRIHLRWYWATERYVGGAWQPVRRWLRSQAPHLRE